MCLKESRKRMDRNNETCAATALGSPEEQRTAPGLDFGVRERLLKGETCLSVVGLGYVGLPIAVAFARKVRVVGFDVNREKVETYQAGKDPTGEAGDQAVKESAMLFTHNPQDLRKASFHVVAVPTPVYDDHRPDLRPLESASKILGQNLLPGSIVVFESTVYPGVTEEVCVPILERESGLQCGRDFKVGYSPERINPGDQEHRLENIRKIVSGMDEETLEQVAGIYSLVVKAGVHRASSIQVAEAAKVIENSQRDINIAFMNELSIIFHRMGIDTREVLEAASTKWNFLPFRPGLVGGHCIGVDPYYLTYRAETMGYHSQVILAGRRINDDMGGYVAEQCVKSLLKAGRPVREARVAILGLAFKENCPDTRNSKVADILRELREYGLEPLVADPQANPQETERIYGVKLQDWRHFQHLDAVILAVAHREFASLTPKTLAPFFSPGTPVLLDVKGLLEKQAFQQAGYLYWRL